MCFLGGGGDGWEVAVTNVEFDDSDWLCFEKRKNYLKIIFMQ